MQPIARNTQILSTWYDAAGNLLNDGTAFGSHSYTWDAENRLTTVSLSGTLQATYTYNALGQRVERQGPGVPWGSHVVDEWYDPFGNYTMLFNGGPLEEILPPVAGRVYGEYSSGYTSFYHANQLGSIGTMTNQAGNWLGSEIFDPWGQFVATTGSAYRVFAGMPKRRDGESGLDDTQNRMYTSQYGRWLSPDPVRGGASNPQSFNLYAYVTNNPTNLVDPEGLCGCNRYGGYGGYAGYSGYQGFGCYDRCDNPYYAISHAECGGSGFPFPPFPPPFSRGGGGGGGGGGTTEPTIEDNPPQFFNCLLCKANCAAVHDGKSFACVFFWGGLEVVTLPAEVVPILGHIVIGLAFHNRLEACLKDADAKYEGCLAACEAGPCNTGPILPHPILPRR